MPRERMEASEHCPELPEAVLHGILKRCDVADVGRSACVDRRWRQVASDDSLWQSLCEKRFDLLTPSDHHGNACPSFKEAHMVWHNNFHMYPHSLVIRTKRCWDYLRDWTSANYPDIADSLLPGVSEEYLNEFEEQLGWNMPLAVRLLYRFCGGQAFSPMLSEISHLNDETDTNDNMGGDRDVVGLFGGYRFYDHEVDVYFVPLPKVLLLTQNCVPHWGDLAGARKWIIVAASLSLQKFFLLDCQDGSLFVGTRNLATSGELMSCVPPDPESDAQDAMLRWLEMYSSRLDSGMYSLKLEYGSGSISLFPELDPLCSEAISSDVQVWSSAVFVPEHSSPEDSGSEKYMFAYSIRMRLLASEDHSATKRWNSCQLSSRHWIIRESGISTEVRGAGVIGEYPLLKRGGTTYSYESCTTSNSRFGYIEGDFTFVPGSLAHPEGLSFLVKVARFPLEVPNFIY